MRKKLTFYMCNHFNSFQVICSHFPPTQNICTATLQSRSFTELSDQKGWILAHFSIWMSKNVLFPVSFKQMRWHHEQWRQLAVTEPKILPENLNTSCLQCPTCEASLQTFPNNGQILIVTHLTICHRTFLCDSLFQHLMLLTILLHDWKKIS